MTLPGVSMKYILQGTLRWESELLLYAPGSGAYGMLKVDVVGGPSLVFTRKHEAGKMSTRSHKYESLQRCKKVLGFHINSLYPSTMLGDVLVGKEKVVHYKNPVEAVEPWLARLKGGCCFGFVEVVIEVSRDLREKFEEFPPLFYNSELRWEAVSPTVKEYLERTGRTFVPRQKKLMERRRCYSLAT